MASFRYLYQVFVVMWMLVNSTCAMHTSFCFRLPKDKIMDHSYGATGESDVSSVGVEKFPQDIWDKYSWHIKSQGGNFGDDWLGPGTTPKTKGFSNTQNHAAIQLEVFSLRGRPRGENPLNGWFRISVTGSYFETFTELFRSFVLYATDEQLNPIGTFELDGFDVEKKQGEDAGDCPPTSATKHMIIPCGGVSKYEPFASNAILYVRNRTNNPEAFPKKYEKYWPIVPDYAAENSLHFYYRLSMQPSNINRGSFILFRLLADPDPTYDGENLGGAEKAFEYNLASVTAWIRLRIGAVPGAADPLPTDRTSLSCDKRLATFSPQYQTDKNSKQQEWFQRTYLSLNWHWYFSVYLSNQFIEQAMDTSLVTDGVGRTLVFAYTFATKTGCTSKFYGGRCNGTLCSLSNEGSGGDHDPNVKRHKASFDMTPQLKSSKTLCTCNWGGLAQFTKCYHELPDPPLMFNHHPFVAEPLTLHDSQWPSQKPEVSKFPELLDLYREEIKGDRCNMSGSDADKIIIKVIRRIARTYVLGRNVTTITTGSLKSHQHVVDRRGVRLFGFGTILYGVRKGHGIMMIVFTFFCIPISVFVSRYFKESFMSIRILYARVWFQIHLQLVFFMFAFGMAGILLAVIGRQFLGVSLHPYGILHRFCGYVTVILFFVNASCGGLRLLADPGRARTIMAHWMLGYLFYISSFFSVISSIHVPGSPTAQRDKSIDENEPTLKRGNYFYLVIVFWILFETVIHVSMDFLLHTYDRWMQVEDPRIYLPALVGVPIPVLKENSEHDASGSGIRLITFWIYIGVSTLCTLVACGMVIKNNPNLSRGFGPMTCTHLYNESLDANLYRYGKWAFKNSLDPYCLNYYLPPPKN